MSQGHGATSWREPAASGATPSLSDGHWVLVSAGVYELRDTGAASASLVSDGLGGYDLSDSTVVGIGRVVVFGSGIGVMY